MRRFVALLAGLIMLAPGAAVANTSHAGWPPLTGMLLMNKLDQSRPLDGRVGSDPFDGTDYSARCPQGKLHSYCVPGGIPVGRRHHAVTCAALAGAEKRLAAKLHTTVVRSDCSGNLVSAALVPGHPGHNELLGGNGSDTIHAGPAGDVIWGDYKPGDQSTTQVDRLYGGPGNDFIYASHGTNYISTGTGHDVVHAHFGRGTIHCGSTAAIVYLSRVSRQRYHLVDCRHVSYNTLGY